MKILQTYNPQAIEDFISEITLEDYEWVKERRIAYLSAKRQVTETMLIISALTQNDTKFYERKISKIDKEIDSYNNPVITDYSKEKDTISDEDIAKAREYPVDSLIEFNKAGSAKCLWHSEKTPSLKYWKKENIAHCFGCSKSADSIDIARFLYNYSFPEAVAYLKKL